MSATKDLNDLVTRAAHTFYQAFLGAFIVLVTNFLGVLQHGGLGAAKAALAGLGAGVIGAVVSALKTVLVQNQK